MVNKPAQEETAAVHEAAHCLLAWLTGLRIHKVTIAGPRIAKGGWTPYYAEIDGVSMCAYNLVNDADLQKRILVNLAPIAEIERRWGVVEALHDSQDALDFCSLGGCKNGGRNIIKRAMEIRDRPDPAATFYAENKPELIKILADPKAQAALDALAQALTEKGSLSGIDAVKTLETAWGDPPPEQALPAPDHGSTLARDQSVQSARNATLKLLKNARDILMDAKPDNDEQETERENLLCDLLQIQFKWGA